MSLDMAQGKSAGLASDACTVINSPIMHVPASKHLSTPRSALRLGSLALLLRR